MTVPVDQQPHSALTLKMLESPVKTVRREEVLKSVLCREVVVPFSEDLLCTVNHDLL